MLKITYLEDAIYLEYLPKSVEAWKAERIIVNLRAAVSIYVESSIASLLLPINLSGIKNIGKLAQTELISIVLCDLEYIEVSLSGTWVAQSESSESGIFVCELSPDSECFLYKLWQESQLETSASIE
ncbi:MAG: alr0857 family protein [Pleurocapsa sp.]